MFKTLARKHGRVRHGYHTDTAAYVSQGKQKNKKKTKPYGDTAQTQLQQS